MKLRTWHSSFIPFVLLAGCTDPGGPAAASGSVSYRGAAVPDGHIVFYAADGSSESCDIEGGRYSVRMSPGPRKVQITSREPDRPNPTPGARPSVFPGKSRIPERYSQVETSGLTADVKPGSNQLDFPLKD